MTSDLNGHKGMSAAGANGFEFFTRLVYCQALLYKTWAETSDELAQMTKSIDPNPHDSKKRTSLYINIFEEKFTNLFRSPEFASNMGKLLNSLLECIKEKDNISRIFLNNLPKISADLKLEKSKNDMKKVGEVNFDNGKGR